MKAFAILFLLSAPVFGAATTTTNIAGDITTKITVRTAKDGKPEVRMESVYRGKTKVMMTVSRRNQQGVLAVSTRAYLADGKLAMIEGDDDSDGILESIAAVNGDTGSFEMFTRQPDGTVKPVSTEKLDSLMRQKAVADKSVRKLLDNPNMSAREISDLLEKNRRQIEKIKKKKSDGD